MARKRRVADIHFYEWSVIRWLGSDTRARLDPAGRGIFHELLDLCYTQGSIPSDFDLMARKADCTIEQLHRVWPIIEKHFQADKKDNSILLNRFACEYRRNYFRYLARQKSNTSHKKIPSCENKVPDKSSHINGMCDGGLHDGVHQDNTIQYDTIQDETTTDKKMAARPSSVSVEWPETTAVIRGYYPATDDPLICEIVSDCVRRYVDCRGSHKLPDLSDMMLSEAVHESHFRKQESAVAFRKTMPRTIQTWVEEAIRKQAEIQ